MIVAAFSASLMNLTVKYLTEIPASQLIFIRCTFGFIICAGILRAKKMAQLPTVYGPIIGVSFFGAIAMVCFFYTIQHLPFGMAVSIRYLMPFFVMILAVFYFGEKINKTQWFSILIVIAGLYLMVGSDKGTAVVPMLLGILGALFMAISYLLVKRASETESALVILNWGFIIAMILLALPAIKGWISPSNIEWTYILLMSSFGLLTAWLVTSALELGDASKVAPIKYLEIITAFAFGYFIFSESYDTPQIVGVGIILMGLIINVFAQGIRPATKANKSIE